MVAKICIFILLCVAALGTFVPIARGITGIKYHYHLEVAGVATGNVSVTVHELPPLVPASVPFQAISWTFSGDVVEYCDDTKDTTQLFSSQGAIEGEWSGAHHNHLTGRWVWLTMPWEGVLDDGMLVAGAPPNGPVTATVAPVIDGFNDPVDAILFHYEGMGAGVGNTTYQYNGCDGHTYIDTNLDLTTKCSVPDSYYWGYSGGELVTVGTGSFTQDSGAAANHLKAFDCSTATDSTLHGKYFVNAAI